MKNILCGLDNACYILPSFKNGRRGNPLLRMRLLLLVLLGRYVLEKLELGGGVARRASVIFFGGRGTEGGLILVDRLRALERGLLFGFILFYQLLSTFLGDLLCHYILLSGRYFRHLQLLKSSRLRLRNNRLIMPPQQTLPATR